MLEQYTELREIHLPVIIEDMIRDMDGQPEKRYLRQDLEGPQARAQEFLCLWSWAV